MQLLNMSKVTDCFYGDVAFLLTKCYPAFVVSLSCLLPQLPLMGIIFSCENVNLLTCSLRKCKIAQRMWCASHENFLAFSQETKLKKKNKLPTAFSAWLNQSTDTSCSKTKNIIIVSESLGIDGVLRNNTSQQCALAAQGSDCVSHGIDSWSREGIVLLCSVVASPGVLCAVLDRAPKGELPRWRV